MAEISYQWLHMRTTVASIKSVQKIKTKDASLSWDLSVAAFMAERAFWKVIVLDLCNIPVTSSSYHKHGPSCETVAGLQSAILVPPRDARMVTVKDRLSRDWPKQTSCPIAVKGGALPSPGVSSGAPCHLLVALAQ